jgi:hypothetical protein
MFLMHRLYREDQKKQENQSKHVEKKSENGEKKSEKLTKTLS